VLGDTNDTKFPANNIATIPKGRSLPLLKAQNPPERVMTGARKSEQYESQPVAPFLTAEVADLFCNLGRALFHPYRPERHYMRGPGPKWHARHAGERAP
jgi:hypothetical protein